MHFISDVTIATSQTFKTPPIYVGFRFFIRIRVENTVDMHVHICKWVYIRSINKWVLYSFLYRRYIKDILYECTICKSKRVHRYNIYIYYVYEVVIVPFGIDSGRCC